MTSPLLELWLSDSLPGSDDFAGRPGDARRADETEARVPRPTRTAPSQVPGLSDVQVVEGVRAGDEAVFSSLWRAYWVPLTQLAYLHLRDRDAADDLVADVLEKVWERHEIWEVRGSITAYLVIAVRNRAMNVLRSDRRRGAAHGRVGDDAIGDVASVDAGVAEHAVDTPERRMALASAVRTLPERYRTILMLRWRFQESWEDVATVLEISVSAAKVQHHRAIRALRERIGGDVAGL